MACKHLEKFLCPIPKYPIRSNTENAQGESALTDKLSLGENKKYVVKGHVSRHCHFVHLPIPGFSLSPEFPQPKRYYANKKANTRNNSPSRERESCLTQNTGNVMPGSKVPEEPMTNDSGQTDSPLLNISEGATVGRMSVHRCARSNTLLNDDVNGLFCTVCSIASRLNCIPFDYDCHAQKLIVVNSRWRKWVWHLSVSLLFLYARFLLVRLFQLMLHLNREEDVRISVYHVVLLLFFLAFLMPTAFQINIWIKKHEIVQGFNQVISASRKQRRRRRSAPLRTTWVERVQIILLPVSCYIGSLIMLTVFIIRPQGDQFLFSILPRRYQTIWAFVVFLVLETFAAISVATTIMFQHVIQVVMLQSCSDIILHNCAQTPIENGEFSRMIATYRQQQILIAQFNHCYSWNIYIFKVVTVIIAVTCNYMLIKSRSYLDSNSYTFIAICAAAFPPLPILLYEQAFKLHVMSEEFLYQMRCGLRFLKYSTNRQYFGKKIKGLPTLHCYSGPFSRMNRKETLTYIFLIAGLTAKVIISL